MLTRSWTLPPPTPGAAAPLTVPLGLSPNRLPVTLNIAALPHLAIIGTSGSGKSTLIRTILTSILTVSTPDDLSLILVDITDELEDLSNIPHLAREPIDDVGEAVGAFEDLVLEMDRRYAMFKRSNVRNITEYNARGEHQLPTILTVVDEFAALMMSDLRKRVEGAVGHLGIRGRKCGIHLMVATQIPHATVLSPIIKANMAGRIALRLPSTVFSRVALDQPGAEKLRGDGDGLLLDGSPSLRRFQAPNTTRDDLLKIVRYWTDQGDGSCTHPLSYAGDAEEMYEPPRFQRSVRIRIPDKRKSSRSRRPRRRKHKWGRVLVAGALVAFAATEFTPGFGGSSCPAGTSENGATMVDTCDLPDGSTKCVMWAAGFTPTRRDASITLTYERRRVPDNGPWCPAATSPPVGLGG